MGRWAEVGSANVAACWGGRRRLRWGSLKEWVGIRSGGGLVQKHREGKSDWVGALKGGWGMGFLRLLQPGATHQGLKTTAPEQEA